MQSSCRSKVPSNSNEEVAGPSHQNNSVQGVDTDGSISEDGSLRIVESDDEMTDDYSINLNNSMSSGILGNQYKEVFS